MSNYRRVRLKRGCYFFTVVTAARRPILTDNISILRNAFAHVRSRHKFTIDAVVVLPDHIHCIWTLPDGDDDFSTRWRLIKSTFSRYMTVIPDEGKRRGERDIWQRRFWEHLIRDDEDFQRHVDYIHYNPVKHGYVECVADWPYSSFRRFVRQGVYGEDWGSPVDGDMDCE